jgi:hypothetical protein
MEKAGKNVALAGLAYWGDCKVSRDGNGTIVEIRLPNGRVEKAESGEEETSKHTNQEIPKQANFFDTSEYDRNEITSYGNVPMSTRVWCGRQERLEVRFAMAGPAFWQEG